MSKQDADWVRFWNELQDLMERHGLEQVFDSYADVSEKDAEPYRRVFRHGSGETVSVVVRDLRKFTAAKSGHKKKA